MTASLFETDHVAWLAEQAATMRRLAAAGTNVPLDLEALGGGLDDMAVSFAPPAPRTATIIQHLLKLEYSPAEEPRRGWQNTVRTARDNLANRITTTIANELEDELDRRQLARRMAQADLESSSTRTMRPSACRGAATTRWRRSATQVVAGARGGQRRTAA
ncbi:MAG: DUF29 family protein [Geminicoccaceae bacterium]